MSRPAASKGGVSAVVVLYNPTPQMLENIESYRDQVDRVIAVDNSDGPDTDLIARLEAMPGVERLGMSGNRGIAAALNAGCRRALELGATWALTMDQDSTATPGMVETMLGCMDLCWNRPVGIIAATPAQVGAPEPDEEPGCEETTLAMTSGNLLALGAFSSAGPFLDELFIDRVDNEYCLRLRARGYVLIRCRDAILVHRLGEITHHRFPIPAYVSHHSPVRRYYITRNSLWVARRYRSSFPDYYRLERRAFLKETLKIVLYERQKLTKLRMSFRGWRDANRNRLGPYSPGS